MSENKRKQMSNLTASERQVLNKARHRIKLRSKKRKHFEKHGD